MRKNKFSETIGIAEAQKWVQESWKKSKKKIDPKIELYFLLEEMGEMAEVIRKIAGLKKGKKKFDLEKEMGDVLLSLITIAIRYNIDLQKAFETIKNHIELKYLKQSERKLFKKARRENNLGDIQKWTITAWKRSYRKFDETLELGYFIKEVGEMVKEIIKTSSGKKRKKQLTKEIGDVLFNLYTLAIRYNIDLQEAFIKVKKDIEKRYE